MVTYNYTVGFAPSYQPYRNSTFLDEYYTDDVYSFSVSETSSLNLNLHNITTGDDADLYLYRDDGDGVFELNEDRELARSRLAGNSDDFINYLVEPGSYFARVERYAPGSQGRLGYDLDLSATPDTPYPANNPADAPNLLPREVELGHITPIFYPNARESITRTGWVGDSDTVDTYHFSAHSSGGGDGVIIDVSLAGLSNDADIRLIEDRNRNQIVDLNEVIDGSTLGGASNDSFSTYLDNFELANYDYFIQVYQYSGDTNYDLNMTFQSTLG